MNRVFQAGGAIPPDSPTYVERKADRLVRQRIEQMDYVHIIVARQMGKTSLLHRLATRLGGERYAFAWVELSGMKDLERAERKALMATLLCVTESTKRSSKITSVSRMKRKWSRCAGNS